MASCNTACIVWIWSIPSTRIVVFVVSFTLKLLCRDYYHPEEVWTCSAGLVRLRVWERERYLRHWATPLKLGWLCGKCRGSGSRREEAAARRADSSNSELVMAVVEQRTGRLGDAGGTGGTGLPIDQANSHYLDSSAAFLSRVRRRQFGKSRCHHLTV